MDENAVFAIPDYQEKQSVKYLFILKYVKEFNKLLRFNLMCYYSLEFNHANRIVKKMVFLK